MRNEQIKVAYEEGGLSPEAIQELMPDMDVEAIKITLASVSAKYRMESCKDEGLFSEKTFKTAGLVIEQLMMNDEFPNVQYRAAKFAINEYKGRHDKKNIRNLNINIHMLNEKMQEVKKAKERAMQDIESTKVE